MQNAFYEKAGSLISPGDIFDNLPYTRIPKPLKVARKFSGSLPKSAGRQYSELREIYEYPQNAPTPPFNFDNPGEEILSTAKIAKALFLTWGSEVESDERTGKLHKKEWLIAPLIAFSTITTPDFRDPRTGEMVNMVQAIKAGKSPKFFALEPFQGDTEQLGYYVDFRKLCPLAANNFDGAPRNWRLNPPALNALYHQLMWFFTRREIFFRQPTCKNCGHSVDLALVFEGQSIEPDANNAQQ
jgi:hypothetical protein